MQASAEQELEAEGKAQAQWLDDDGGSVSSGSTPLAGSPGTVAGAMGAILQALQSNPALVESLGQHGQTAVEVLEGWSIGPRGKGAQQDSQGGRQPMEEETPQVPRQAQTAMPMATEPTAGATRVEEAPAQGRGRPRDRGQADDHSEERTTRRRTRSARRGAEDEEDEAEAEAAAAATAKAARAAANEQLAAISRQLASVDVVALARTLGMSVGDVKTQLAQQAGPAWS